MKIGIITIQKSEVNFGACLQSYALWKYITRLGYDCEVIDLLRPCHTHYKKSKMFGEYEKPYFNRLKHFFADTFIKRREKEFKSNKLLKFNEKIKYSKTYRSVEDLYNSTNQYDILISGSDQIWNPNMPFVNDPYFLTFADSSCKKISYASSFGITEIPQTAKANYKKWLSDYNQISTREICGSHIVESLIGKKAEVVLDPVFLLKKEDWQNEMKSYSGIDSKKYVFLYMLHYDDALLGHAVSIALEKRLPLIFVLSEQKKIKTNKATQLNNIGPEEWIWLIANADTMITTSFHGSAFCIIFQTPLKIFLKETKQTNSRIQNLLLLLQIKHNQYYLNDNNYKVKIECTFDESLNKTIDTIRNESISYLKTALSE